MKHDLICIGCPMGCEMSAEAVDGAVHVEGHQCKTGAQYANVEMTRPTRNIATSVRVTGGDMPMLSVKLGKPVPKEKIRDCVDAIRGLTVAAPVRIYDTILADVAGTGVDAVATRHVGTGTGKPPTVSA